MACFVLIVLFLRNQREQAGCLLVFMGLKDSPDTNNTGGIWSVTIPCLGKKNGSFSGVCGTSLGQYIRLNSSNPCTSVWKAGRPSSQPHRPWVVLACPLSIFLHFCSVSFCSNCPGLFLAPSYGCRGSSGAPGWNQPHPEWQGRRHPHTQPWLVF